MLKTLSLICGLCRMSLAVYAMFLQIKITEMSHLQLDVAPFQTKVMMYLLYAICIGQLGESFDRAENKPSKKENQ